MIKSKKQGKSIIGVFSDLHTGHLCGLTPKEFQSGDALVEIAPLIKEFWTWFSEAIKKYSFTHAFWLGDLVDGEGKKDTTHLLTSDINVQMDMACSIIKKVNAPKNTLVYGTPYHSSGCMDYEDIIAERIKGDIKTRQKVHIDGINFDLSHKIMKSGAPSGGDVALKNTQIWSHLYDFFDGDSEKADYIIRGHIHEYRLLESGLGSVITMPALKLGIPKYDRYARGLNGYYTVGFLVFEIENGVVSMKKEFFKYKVSEGYKRI